MFQTILKIRNTPNILKFQKENIICEDGFCSMPNLKESPDINENDTNIFEST